MPTRVVPARSAVSPKPPDRIGLLIDRPSALVAVAASLAAVGAIWIALQPTATHSALDRSFDGALLRWLFYLPLTLLAIWSAAWIIHTLAPRAGRPPIRTTLLLASMAVLGGTVGETGARAMLGHGDVLAIDGVLHRVIELFRVDVPTAAVAVIVVSSVTSTTSPIAVPDSHGIPGQMKEPR